MAFIIGKDRSGLNRLEQQLPGVQEVFVLQEQVPEVPGYFEIHVTGENEMACNEVCAEVERTIEIFEIRDIRTAFDHANSSFDTIRLRRFRKNSSELVVVGNGQREDENERNLFAVSEFVQLEPIPFPEERGHENFFDFSEEKVASFFDPLLSSMQQSANTELSFRIRLGKIIFNETDKIFEKQMNETDEISIEKKKVGYRTVSPEEQTWPE